MGQGLIIFLSETQCIDTNAFFTSVGVVKEIMQDLFGQDMEILLPITGADEMFSELWEHVSALNRNHVNKNMGHDIMIAKCKKISIFQPIRHGMWF
jgi:hypothetical protein